MATNGKRAFRFGVGPGGLNPVDDKEWAELARKAEALGYSTLSVSDHIMHYGPFAAMGLAAGVTTTLRVGTLVLCNDFYHPVVLAREAMTLDALSGGRVELGIGAGWMNVAPDLVVEILSPSETNTALEEKLRDYRMAGTRLIWVVDAAARVVTVRRADGSEQSHSEGDTLDGGAVLPGFAIPVARIFARLAR